MGSKTLEHGTGEQSMLFTAQQLLRQSVGVLLMQTQSEDLLLLSCYGRNMNFKLSSLCLELGHLSKSGM